MTTTTRNAGPEPGDGVLQVELAADMTSARHARAAIRQAFAGWGIDDPSGDTELLASELVANAAEHGGGPVSLALRRHTEADGRPGITCEITDTSPAMPQPRQAGMYDERGRGQAIVAALAQSSGVHAGQAGKTSWFTLALADRAHRIAQQIEPEPEPEAGA